MQTCSDVSLNRQCDDVVMRAQTDAIPRWLPLFIDWFLCHVCVAPACLCKCAWVRVSVSAQVLGGGRGRNERWWRCEERAAAASFTALLIPLQSQCLSFSFQEKCGVCGRVGSAINAGCQRENAGVYTMPLNHWVKVFLLHSPPPRTFSLFIFSFQGGQKHQKAVSQGCIQWKIWARGWTVLVQ